MLEQMGKQAKAAALRLMTLDAATKERGLLAVADALEQNTDIILTENKKDVDAFLQKGGSAGMADRLSLTKDRIFAMADGVRKVNALPDPIGEVLGMTKRPNGLVIGQKRVPLGVIGIIYEARPNVTVDAAGACLESS